MTTNTTHALRSRLLLAMGLGALAATGPLACGGATSTGQHGPGAAGSGGSGVGGTSAAGGKGLAGGGEAGQSGAGAAGRASGGSAAGGAAASTGGVTTGGFETIRRPFLVGASMRSAGVVERGDWTRSVAPIALADARTAARLASSWLQDALEEHASVAAFARFSMLLLSVGAPPELVVASQRASLDEVEHARACFALARRYGAREVGPTRLEVADSLSALSLAELAALTVAEGCVGETLGALLAADQLARASDTEVARILKRIAKDEARHAELAWHFLAWAFAQGEPGLEFAVNQALYATVAEIEATPILDYGIDVELWHAHGRVTCAEARALARTGIRDVVEPCLRALMESVRRPSRGDRSDVV